MVIWNLCDIVGKPLADLQGSALQEMRQRVYLTVTDAVRPLEPDVWWNVWRPILARRVWPSQADAGQTYPGI